MKFNVDETDLEKTLKTEHRVAETKDTLHKENSPKKEKCHDDCKCDSESSEQIGFHKGCLNTLVGERNELIKMVQTVETIMSAHIKKLQELGVPIETGNKE